MNVAIEDTTHCFEEEIDRLDFLLDQLKSASSYIEKIAIIETYPEVESFNTSHPHVQQILEGLTPEHSYLIKALIVIKQAENIFDIPNDLEDYDSLLNELVNQLVEIESLYKEIGGIIGYQLTALQLLQSKIKKDVKPILSFIPPKGIDISEASLEVRKSIIEGITMQEVMAEFYPVGGAADRLELKDEITQEGLPAARLVFLGKGLLEGVIGDLQAREYLHYKIFGRQVITPIALMTSKTNHNHEHIQEICALNHWFGRPKESFMLFIQPSIPAFTSNGIWCLKGPLMLLLKPGGHGVIWKLARDEGVLDWLQSLHKQKAVVRQINNPMAGIDYGLLAFLGVGHRQNKIFGFSSCSRLVNAQEGMNVLKCVPSINGYTLALTNIEYCDFDKFGIIDKPQKPGGEVSHFPSNTNILFVDLSAIVPALEKTLFPGMLINFKKDLVYSKNEGNKVEETARLESTMQNIADSFGVEIEDAKSQDIIHKLPTYLTFNKRRKTISTTKFQMNPKTPFLETPLACFYDFVQNTAELLEEHCRIEIPKLDSPDIFFTNGPSFLMNYHPSLGPLFSIISQKIHGGRWAFGAELKLEIADLEMIDVNLEGSLVIIADSIMGHSDSEKTLHYSTKTGKCCLKNVTIENQGIDREKSPLFWKHMVQRKECALILLRGNSQFVAENIKIRGDITIEVPDGMEMVAKEENGKIVFDMRPLDSEKPFWNYSITQDYHIKLTRNKKNG